MTNSSFLCGGTGWDRDGAFLRLSDPAGQPAALRLGHGAELRFRIRSEAPRYCLGYELVHEEGRKPRACPDQAAAERGYQCRRCFFADEGRLVHNSHRGGDLPAGLRSFLARPQWLYIATFADGTTKVGTAADQRKTLRLTEQGALAAQYVARAANGLQVRILEDAVSSGLGLPQAVRSGHKCASLAAALPDTVLESINAGHADDARTLLLDREQQGFDVVKEAWTRPEAFDAVLQNPGAGLYPLPLGAGEHGLVLRGMLGSTALAATDDVGLSFLADLTALKGQRLELGAYSSALPALQEPLF
ncbi:DUF2797 domain-containing protein [Arthrobacter sp. zg-Y916]|uniref:DUF2797 domain-containing protein n=1 Tax=Arthrobacter sp. zg-Y916 TaxID=2894190 RepID=UPI001E39D047|nr:DUF2797 domain-containing protein [Arthrobacter sp. zg-Y916]MCC9192576.1 DUF2797 domain-containing protein [Arthrobacter sp. zg-Y916]